MGACSSQQQLKQPKPLIRLMKIEMDNKAEQCKRSISLWKEIDSQLKKLANKKQISSDLIVKSDEINEFLLKNKNEKSILFFNGFQKLFDQFQQSLTDEVMKNEEVWENKKTLFKNLDQINEQFIDIGLSSKVVTQSLTKY